MAGAAITPTAAATTSRPRKKAGTLEDIRAFILVDMIGDRDLVIRREANSTPWLTDAIWGAAKRLNRREFVAESTPIEDDHLRVPQRRRPVGRHHRPRVSGRDLPLLAHAGRHARARRRRKPAGRRRRAARRAACARDSQLARRSLTISRRGSQTDLTQRPLRSTRVSCVRTSAAISAISARDPRQLPRTDRIVRSSSTASDFFASARIRSTTSSLAVQPALLEPEDHVRSARHRADVDLLLAADQAGRHAGVHRVDQLAVVLADGLDHRGGVDAGRGAERVAADDRDSSRESARRSPPTPPRSTRRAPRGRASM